MNPTYPDSSKSFLNGSSERLVIEVVNNGLSQVTDGASVGIVMADSTWNSWLYVSESDSSLCFLMYK